MDLSRFEDDLLGVDMFDTVQIKFDAYCDLLRKNDPRITEIRFRDHLDPENGNPYHRIGQALQGNTHITVIEVQLGRLYTLNDIDDVDDRFCYDYLDSEKVNDLVEEGAESADPLLRYLRSCSSLRALQLTSFADEEWNLVNGRLARLFYQAILDNPHGGLEELHVDEWEEIDIPQEEFTHLLATQPLKRLTLRAGAPLTLDILEDLQTFCWSFTAPWLYEALHSCPSLEYLALLDREFGTVMQYDGFFNGVISNLGPLTCLRELRVKLLDSTNEDLPAETLSQLLMSTGSLETLDLDGFDFSSEGMKDFVAGLQSNDQTLVKRQLPIRAQ
jgi:hypothetical protein